MGTLENAQAAAKLVADDEDVVAAIRVQSRGQAMGVALGGVAGAGVARLVRRRADAKAAAAAHESFPLTGALVVAATRSRLLVWEQGGLAGKPKAFLGDVALERVQRIETAKSAIGPGNLALVIQLEDVAAVKLEGSRRAVRQFVEATAPMLGRP